MCRYMGINAFGTDNFLRGAIRTRLLELRRDDQLIAWARWVERKLS